VNPASILVCRDARAVHWQLGPLPPPRGRFTLIAWKDGLNSSLLVEPREIDCLDKVSRLNEKATSVHDLYPDGTTTCGSIGAQGDYSPANANFS